VEDDNTQEEISPKKIEYLRGLDGRGNGLRKVIID